MKKIVKLITISLCFATTTFAMEEEGNFKTKTLNTVQATRDTLNDIPLHRLAELSKKFLELAHPQSPQQDECFAAKTNIDMIIHYYTELTKELDGLNPSR